MGEILQKLRPDRDLQCYFEQPSAIAALSDASAAGFTVSGTWRQQFDWCVVEWNRDNGFEHPAFRSLPDGDLSGLVLTYEELRQNVVPIDSDLYSWVDWPNLRIWVAGRAEPYKVALRPLATAVEGSYGPATAEFELTGSPTPGDYVGLSWGEEQYNHLLNSSDTLATAALAVANATNAFSPTMRAACDGARITLTCIEPGANQNRLGAYGFVSGARTEQWTPDSRVFAGGASPSKWRIEIRFHALKDLSGTDVPVTNIRKLRWTWAADMQRGGFARTDFAVRISNWVVSGTGREYRIAGPGSIRVEDDAVALTGAWSRQEGNHSGGSLHVTTEDGAEARCEYTATVEHALYTGVIRNDVAGEMEAVVDGVGAGTYDLRIPAEEVKARVRIGVFGPGTHSVMLRRISGSLYLDFFEVVIEEAEVPDCVPDQKLTLATDWDTEHSLALAPERTAWMIDSMGFRGRVNHYVGAMWFYELVRVGHAYASASVVFDGTPEFGARTELTVGRSGDPGADLVIAHVHRIGDTAETVVRALELAINAGYTAIRAVAEGGTLRLYARAMGAEGNGLTLSAVAGGSGFSKTASGSAFTGGTDGEWRTDLLAVPRLNRAARDWHRSFFKALAGRGLDAASAFSLELRHGDPSLEAGIAQRCPEGDPVILNTPAIQTNFSPASRTFWKPVYTEMAGLMKEAGLVPYLQFGEVQWWYFRDQRSGMPYYDEHTKQEFRNRYGREMATITDWDTPPELHIEEACFLSELIGEFTTEVVAHVRESYPECRVEVLYPLDVNETAWNRAVNYPVSAWTPGTLDCLKTESFGYTYARDLDKCLESIRFPFERGFGAERSAHLIGLGDARSPWDKEAGIAIGEGVKSVVLFALDQFCLVGYALPALRPSRRARFDD
ncbi:MAG TPA: hypothetical protein VN428_01560 [Bryobacteraceae bacterium]|nr:hypothetical protein [Bryobacteraceae bacterium]